MADKVAGLLFKISADTRALRQGFKQTKKSVSSVQKSMVALKGAMIAAFGSHTVLNAIRNVAKTFMDFEQSMANVKAITGANQKEFAELSRLARALGGSTKYTASEVAQLETEYAKLGFTTEEIKKAAGATLNLASAVGTELARAAEVAGGVIRGFQMDAAETGRVTDVMAKSFTSSALDMEKFAESMKYVAPVANVANITLEETTSMLALLADNMISGSMAGTSLRVIINQLAKDGRPLAEQLKELSERGLSLADAEEEVGKRAQTALLVLARQADKLPELTTEFQKAGGAAEEMADIQLNTLKGQLTIMQSAFAELKITIGELATASGELKKGIEGATTSIQKFTSFLKSDYVVAIRQAVSSTWDLLNPLRILVRHWDKITGKSSGWVNKTPLGGSFFGTKTKPPPVPGGGGLNLLGAGKKGILGGAYAMGGGFSSMTGKGFGIGGGPKGNITPGAINSQGVMQFFTQLNTMGIKLKETTVPKIKEAMMDLSTVMQQTFMGAVDAFGQGVTNLFSGTAKLENFFQGVISTFGGFLSQLGKMMVAYGLAQSAIFSSWAEGPAGAIKLIAAGAALVAIGSAISGLASRGPAMAGGGGGATGGGASMSISGQTKIDGRNIVIAYDRGLSLAGAVT